MRGSDITWRDIMAIEEPNWEPWDVVTEPDTIPLNTELAYHSTGLYLNGQPAETSYFVGALDRIVHS